MQGEGWVGGCKGRDKMVLERLDGLFCGIAFMIAGGGELIVGVVGD